MDIETALDEFIADKTPRTLVLQGTWGRGKTHLWNNRWQHYVASSAEKKTPARRYAYVSLFGLNSISEVRVALGLASFESEPRIEERGKWSWIRQKLHKGASLSTQVDLEVPTIGLGTKQIAQVFAHSRAKDLLACFDDIERRGKDLSIRDVLGLVSDLNTQRNCSVVVILNDASLGDDQKDWDDSREKVFGKHLTFAPASDKCVSLIIPVDEMRPLLTHVRKALIDLGITNVRIVDRVRAYAEEVLAALQERQLADATWRKMGRSISILTFCHMGQGEGAPRLKFALSHGAFSSYFQEKNNVPELEKSWGRLLDNFHSFLDHALDKALTELVVQGHIESGPLVEATEEFERGALAEDAKNAFHNVWDIWRHTFQNNRDEVLREFAARFPPAASSLSANNADATFQLLRSFGAGDLANELMEEWMRHRTGERSKELHPQLLNEFEKLRDQVFIARTEEEFARAGKHLPPFGDAILKLGERQGHNPEDIDAIAAATPDQIVQFLLANNGRQLVMGVKASLELGGDAVYDKAAENVRAALSFLAARSDYESDRIKRAYGVVAGARPDEQE
jgi:hypothetical protein